MNSIQIAALGLLDVQSITAQQVLQSVVAQGIEPNILLLQVQHIQALYHVHMEVKQLIQLSILIMHVQINLEL